MRKRNYRKIYEQYCGTIPLDENGRTFDIHHKDGNRENNDPSNLIALSIQEHYEIHKKQGDVGACWIMQTRLNLTKEEISEIGREMAKRAVPRTDEWKRKQSESQKGIAHKPHSEETKRKIGIASKGNQYSKGRKHSEETLAKMRKPKPNKENYKGPKTEEHKKKIKESSILAWKKRKEEILQF